MKKGIFLTLTVLMAATVYAEQGKKVTENGQFFYVYHDKGDRQNHYIPSGWMGDYGDLKLNDGFVRDVPKDGGRTAIEWTYSAKATNGANWAGAFWQNPANNWGSLPGGYDLTGYKRLTFWAKADRPAKIAEFKVGGITGEHSDSDSANLAPVEVTEKWTKYTIDLADKNLTNIIGGFAWSASRDDNQEGFKLYLDEIRFER